MVYSDKHKYIFASMPKAGTHSMYAVLQNEFDGTRHPTPKTFHHVIQTGRIDPKYKDYFKFSIVVNPFRRAVSAWKPLAHLEPYRTKRGWVQRLGGEDLIHFTRYIKQMCKPGMNPPKKYMILSQNTLHGNIQFDRILRLDNIQEEFNQLPFVDRHIDFPNTFTKNNFKHKDDWKKLYTDEAIQNVLDAWGDDFDKYGYKKEL